jgi:ParE toxin of type II toxin-antitoxin system, parDE
MTGRFVLSPRAQTDLDDIWNYTADRWGLDQAETYTRDIWQRIEEVAAIPSAIIRAWKTNFRSPDPSLPYPIILFNADSALEECLATTTGQQPDDSRFFFLDNTPDELDHSIQSPISAS